jgi:hypothetical protein
VDNGNFCGSHKVGSVVPVMWATMLMCGLLALRELFLVMVDNVWLSHACLRSGDNVFP